MNRPFATTDHMVHGGGQAHCYSRTGTSKQRQVELHRFRSLFLMSQGGNNNELARHHVPCDPLLQKAY